MKINPPFTITPRLLPGLQIGKAFISIEYHGTRDSRTTYEYHIDLPDGTSHTGNDLRSGCGGGSLQDGMGSLLSFLAACAESYGYNLRTGRGGENIDLFPPNVAEWAYQNSDEISMLQLEIEESETVLIEE